MFGRDPVGETYQVLVPVEQRAHRYFRIVFGFLRGRAVGYVPQHQSATILQTVQAQRRGAFLCQFQTPPIGARNQEYGVASMQMLECLGIAESGNIDGQRPRMLVTRRAISRGRFVPPADKITHASPLSFRRGASLSEVS